MIRVTGTAHVLYMLPLIVREKGVSPQVVGLLWTILPGISLITSTIAGTLADRLKAHRAIFLFSLICLTSGVCSLVFIPKMPMAEGDVMDATTSTGHNNASLLYNGDPFTDIINNNNSNTHMDALPREMMIDPEMVVGEGQPALPVDTKGMETPAAGEEAEVVDSPLTEFVKYPQFWLVFFALLVEQIGISICVMISDAVCFLILGKILSL